MLDRIDEIRVEEVRDLEEGNHYYCIYYTINDKIKMLGKSSIKPLLCRYISEVY